MDEALQLAARQRARQQLERFRAQNPLQWVHRPADPIPRPFAWMPRQLEAFHRFAPGLAERPPEYDFLQRGRASPVRLKKIFGFLAGNRAGKTEWAVRVAIASILGLNPVHLHTLGQDPRKWNVSNGRGRLLWAVTTIFEKSRDTQQRYFAERLPRAFVKGNTTWNEKTGYHNNVLPLVNGARVVFKTAEQGLLTFEGDPASIVWVDERVPLPYINALLARLVDRQGVLIWSSWPSGPEFQDVFLERKSGSGDADGIDEADVDYVTGAMADNVYLQPAEIKLIEKQFRASGASEAEIDARLRGIFSFKEGLVYPEFEEITHLRNLAAPFPIGRGREDDWTVDEVIDPGWRNPCAVAFCCVDKSNRRGVYDEIYDRGRTVAEIAAMIYAKRWEHRGLLTDREIEEFKAKTINRDVRAAEGLAAVAYAADQIKATIDAYRTRLGDCAPRAVWIDEAAKQKDQAKPVSEWQQFRHFGIEARLATNADKVGQRTKLRGELRPLEGIVRLWVNARCEKLRWEFRHFEMAKPNERTGEYHDDVERVISAHNHLIACLEYWISSDPQYVPIEQQAAAPGTLLRRMQELEAARKKDKAWKKRLG